jgi:hypothetical protein
MSASPFFQFRDSYFAAARSSLSTIVIRSRLENNTEPTYVQQSGDTHAITDGGKLNLLPPALPAERGGCCLLQLDQ